jgi:hypothetical protein
MAFNKYQCVKINVGRFNGDKGLVYDIERPKVWVWPIHQRALWDKVYPYYEGEIAKIGNDECYGYREDAKEKVERGKLPDRGTREEALGLAGASLELGTREDVFADATVSPPLDTRKGDVPLPSDQPRDEVEEEVEDEDEAELEAEHVAPVPKKKPSAKSKQPTKKKPPAKSKQRRGRKKPT